MKVLNLIIMHFGYKFLFLILFSLFSVKLYLLKFIIANLFFTCKVVESNFLYFQIKLLILEDYVFDRGLIFSPFQHNCWSYESSWWSSLLWSLWNWLQSPMAWSSFQNPDYYNKTKGCNESATTNFILKNVIPSRSDLAQNAISFMFSAPLVHSRIL